MNTSQLVAQAHRYIDNSIAPSTRQTYRVAQTRYVNFCHAHGLTALPITSNSAILFATDMEMNGLTYRTLKIYLAAITRLNIEAGYPNTVRHDPLLQCALQGIKRQHGETGNTRLPITIQVMRSLKKSITHSQGYNSHDKRMLWAAFTLAFFAFLRVGEFTSPTQGFFDANRTLLGSDISLQQEDIHIRIKVSKTDPFRHGSNVIIAPSGSDICAVTAYKSYRDIHRFQGHLPAFQFSDGKFLTRQAVSSAIHQLLTQAGIPDAHLYNTHSFRSGAATTAAEANLPDWLIKTLGRWRSDSYQVYIKTPRNILRSVPARMTES